METKEIKSEKLYKEFLVSIPFTEVDENINNKIKDLIPNVSIPGFRKGKAPLNIVKKKYENNVLNDVLENIIQTKTKKLIEEKKFTLFRQPKINLKKFEKNKPVEIEISFDLQPKIILKDFSKISLNKYSINISQKLIDEQYGNFIKSQKEYKKIQNKRSVIKTDRVFVNINTLDNEIPEYLRAQNNLPVDIESDMQILPKLGDKLLSSKPKEGDNIQMTFDLSEVLKNKEKNNVKFDIEIISIEEQVEFKMNKDFLKKNGFEKEEDLKIFIKNNIETKYNEGVKQIEKKQLMDLLDKEYKFDLPEGVLKDDFEEIWHRIEKAKKEGKLDDDDKSISDTKLKERYKNISKRRVKLAVLLQHIAKEEKISISEDELSKELMNYASQYPGQEKKILEYFKKNPASVESIRGPILEQKILDKIMSKANNKKKKINDNEYKELEQKTFNINKGKKNAE